MSYDLMIKDDTLILRTSSFRAEKGSVLHSGIYNRELASSLAAGGVLMLLGFFFAASGKITVVHLVSGAAVFAVLFLVSRRFLFREVILEALFDRVNDRIDTSVRKIVGSVRQVHKMSELSGICLDHVTVQPENPDGIRVVEKIALQHGTVIPGFGKIKEFHVVQLDFSGERVSIFSSGKKEEAEALIARLKGFVSDSPNRGA
ncbi:MAG TPA: hypothetical protein VFG09_05865 [Thermodesulfovibrionales bacterium]|jgi:hypothetical protein|nr:hypothetical protein [Thermodesulfovibrionales bacterium]